MAPSSSGGTTVGEALNILERTDLSKASKAQYLHRFIEASRIAFADRGRWVGDPAFEDVPTKELLSQRFADSRECLIKDDAVLTSPLAPGDPRHPAAVRHRWHGRSDHVRGRQHHAPDGGRQVGQRRRLHPHHRADRRQRHHRARAGLHPQQRADGLLLHPGEPGRARPEPAGARQAAAVVDLADDRARPAQQARGGARVARAARPSSPPCCRRSPGSSTGGCRWSTRSPRHAPASATPRRPSSNPGLYDSAELREQLEAIGHRFKENPEIGAATGVQRLPGGKWLAAAETVRRGGGSAMVVRPVR